jgi:hypothetical protein
MQFVKTLHLSRVELVPNSPATWMAAHHSTIPTFPRRHNTAGARHSSAGKKREEEDGQQLARRNQAKQTAAKPRRY